MQIQAMTFESGDINRQTFDDNYETDLSKPNGVAKSNVFQLGIMTRWPQKTDGWSLDWV